MRWSQMHIPTLREDPADAGAPSHRLLVRAGYIRQLQAGHYSLLPLAVRVRIKVIEIIRQEMNVIGDAIHLHRDSTRGPASCLPDIDTFPALPLRTAAAPDP